MSTAPPKNSKNESDSGTGFLRSLGLSLLVHLLLIAALTWGVNWRQTSLDTPVQAELWSATVQQAAPLPAPATPVIAPQPVVRPEPEPEPVKPPVSKPEPVPVQPLQPPPAPQVDPQIAIEKAKKLKALKEKQVQEQQRLKEEQRRRDQEREQADLQEKQAKAAKAAIAAKEREKQEKIDKAEKIEKAKAEREKLAKQEAEKQAKAEREQSRLDAARSQAAADKARADALRRMNQLAGQPGGPDNGRDRQNSAPSDGYLGRIAGRIKPNVVYTGDKSAAIVASFEVRLNADGRIVSIQMVASSGIRAWDEAAQRAIEKTEVFPLDGGRVHSPMTIRMTPRD